MKYLIESIEHDFGGRHMVWWRPKRLGYTTVIEEAGRYSKEEADEIVKNANYGNTINELAWSEEDVLINLKHRHKTVVGKES